MSESRSEVRMPNAVFDQMSWPIPNAEASYRLRYGCPTREDQLQAASEMDAYAALIARSQKLRNYICAYISKAMAANDRKDSPAC